MGVKDLETMRWEDDGGPPELDDDPVFTIGSGNVWADMCNPDDAECMVRAEQRFAEAEAQATNRTG